MIPSDYSHSELSSPGESGALNQVTFSQIYDQYAPVLLGVIMTIVGDEAEAVRLLEITFMKVSSQSEHSQPEGQPLFVWLLSIARSTALEVKESQKKSDPPVLQLTGTGGVVTGVATGNTIATSVKNTRFPISFPMSELIDAVLFEKCTPEEAASALGLPGETARKQLRQAMQQLRTRPAA